LETAKDLDEVKEYLKKSALMKIPPADFDDYLIWDLENHKFIEPFAKAARR